MDGLVTSLTTAVITIIISFSIAFLVKILVLILNKTSRPKASIVKHDTVVNASSDSEEDIAAVIAIAQSLS